MTWIGEQSQFALPEALMFFDQHTLGISGATVSTNSQSTPGNLLVSNLLTDHLDELYRSDSVLAASLTASKEILVRFNFGKPRTIRHVSLIRGNQRLPWRTRIYEGDPATGAAIINESPVSSSIVRAHPSQFPTWSSMPTFSLGPSLDNIELWAAQFRLHSIIELDETFYNIQHLDVVFDATEGINGEEDFVQFSLCQAGVGFQPEINILLGWDVGQEDTSVTKRVESQAVLGRKRPVLKGFGFTIGYSEPQEMFSRILTDWGDKSGKLGRVLFWPEPQQRIFFYDTAFIGTLTNLPAAVMANLNLPAGRGFQAQETK
jgi:hypothetical protein